MNIHRIANVDVDADVEKEKEMMMMEMDFSGDDDGHVDGYADGNADMNANMNAKTNSNTTNTFYSSSSYPSSSHSPSGHPSSGHYSPLLSLASPHNSLALSPPPSNIPDCQIVTSAAQAWLSLMLIFGIIISYMPQQVKIIRSRSSDGLSPWYLMLGAISSYANLVNIVVLQAPIIFCCLKVSFSQCLLNLLGLFQVFVQVSMFYIVYLLFYLYYPTARKYSRNGERVRYSQEWRSALLARKIVLCSILGIASLSVAVGMFFGVPSLMAAIWTSLLAILAMIASAIQFVPQIMRTWKLKMVGALSIPAMLMQTPGSFLFCYTIAMSPGTNISSWINYFLGGCLQGILLVLSLYFHYTQPAEFIVIHSDTLCSPQDNRSDGSSAELEAPVTTIPSSHAPDPRDKDTTAIVIPLEGHS